MAWRELTSDDDIPRFVDAAIALHRGLLGRIDRSDRPHVLDYWLRLFNHSRAHLLEEGDRPLALVTIPRVADRHSYRWQTRTLAVHPAWRGRVTLPDDVELTRSFTMPASSPEPAPDAALAGARHEAVQLAYVRRLESPEEPKTSEWAFRAIARADLPAVTSHVRAWAAAGEEGMADTTSREVTLRQVVELGMGWAYLAVRRGAAAPIGVAVYTQLPIPLVGVPAALVDDLVVDPSWRRRGVARTLQAFAHLQLARRGVRWVHGNILPENVASRRQAIAVGRTLWSEVVYFDEEE